MPSRLFAPIAALLIFAAVAAPAAALPSGFTRVTVASGFVEPTIFAFKGRKIMVGEKASGKILVANPDGSVRADPYVTLHVSAQSERGLLGIAVPPDFETSKFVYVYYTTGQGALNYSGSPKNRVSRFTTVQGAGTDETILLDNIPSDGGNHNGGDIQFGPDGMLYVAVGDGGDFHDHALQLDTLRGKILRIGPNGKIPTGNPYKLDPIGRRCGKPGPVPPGNGPCKEIFAYGLRNPFRISVRPSNGTIIIGDVGEGTWEELSTLVIDGNYGWNIVEGPCPLAAANCTPNPSTYPEEFELPIHFYRHSGAGETGRTIIAGAFAENLGNYPSPYAGAYFYGDFSADWVHLLTMARDNTVTSQTAFDTLNAPVAFRNGSDGTIYVLSYGDGALYKYQYTAP